MVLAVDGAEPLDVLGPVEVFEYAGREVPGAYRIDVVRELQAWIADQLDEDLSVAALADRAHLSERSFARFRLAA